MNRPEIAILLIAWLLTGCQRADPVAMPTAAAPAEPMTQPDSPAIPAQVTRRWAVLSSQSLVQSGFGDLLLVELGKSGLTLVEREKLDAALKELSLTGLSAAQASQQRVNLGKLLAADGLVLLSEVKQPSGQALKVILCDGRQGARLRTDYLPLGEVQVNRQAAELAPAVQALMAESEKRFAGGLKRIFAVPPFVSESLAHDHAHLQLGLAELLSNTLSVEPGTAVIEFEEAQSLAAEVWLAAGIERAVPSVVQGSFRVLPNAATAHFTVKLVRGGQVIRTIEKKNLDLVEAGVWVRDELARQILPGEGEKANLTTKEQFQALIARADGFTSLGYWEEATGLREAALLLQDDARQRQQLMGEYCQVLGRPLGVDRGQQEKAGKAGFPEHKPFVPPGWQIEDCRPGDPRWERLVAPRAELIYRWLGHLDHLVRREQIRGIEALMQDHRQPCYRYPPSESFYRLELFKRQRIGDLWQHLAGGANDPKRLAHFQRWSNELCNLIHLRYDCCGLHVPVMPETKELDLSFYRLLGDLLEATPPGYQPTEHMVRWFDMPRTLVQGHYGNAKDWHTHPGLVELCGRLRKSDRPALAALGRLGQVSGYWKHEKHHANAPYEPTDVQRQLVELMGPAADSKKTSVQRSAGRLWTEIDKGLNPAKYARNFESSGPVKFDPPTLGELRFEKIDIQVSKLDGKTLPLAEAVAHFERSEFTKLVEYIACRPGLSVFWHPGQVLYLRKPPLMQEVLVDPDKSLSHAVWDGRWLWVGSLAHRIHVLDEFGKVVTVIDKRHGLPPCNRALFLHPLAPGKVLAIGCFGMPARSWLAVIEHEKETKVDVFHEATKLQLPGQKGTDYAVDLKSAFLPIWVFPYQGIEAHAPKLLLVNRNMDTRDLPQGPQPLAIDLETRKLTLFPQQVNSWPQLVHQGEIWGVRGSWVSHNALPGRTWTAADVSPTGPPQWSVADKEWRPCCHLALIGDYGQLFRYQDRFYAVGNAWFRIDPDRRTEYRLVQGLLPNPYAGCKRAAVHDTLGVITWNPRQLDALYRVTLPAEK